MSARTLRTVTAPLTAAIACAVIFAVVVEPEVKPAAKPVKAAKKSVAAKPVKAPKPAAVGIVISVEEISLRAYYIAERRQAMGWPGDSSHDWIEAERQLKAEAKRKAKA